MILDSHGLIIKEERVISVLSNVLHNTLVLENKGYYPGYFGDHIPDTCNPRSLFIILNKKYENLFLARTLKKIQGKMDHACYGSYGKLIIKSKPYYCIRIKNLDCFGSIPKIQQALIDSGIGMMPFKDVDNIALISIWKNFLLAPLTVGIYADQFESDRYYLEIPFSPDWETFREATSQVKNNIDNRMFDAALAMIYTINGLVDLIRIYDQKQDLRRLTSVRERYLFDLGC